MKTNRIFIALLAFILFSCNDYLDVNTSPNSVQTSLVTPNLALSAAETNTFRNFSTTANQLGNVFMQNWGPNVNSFTGGYTQEFTLNLSNTFYASIWDQTYRTLGNFQAILNSTSPNYDNHKAIARIMKAFYMQYLVDLYGDVPYSQALQFAANTTPKYDDDKVIYQQLIIELNQAIADINAANANTIAVGSEDAIFSGNMTNWVKFANTIKLRILLRESKYLEANDPTYLSNQFAALASASFVDANVTINPGYNSSTDNSANPFYVNYGYTTAISSSDPTGFTPTTNFSFVRATKYVANFLNAATGSGIATVDPRRGKIYSLVGTGTAAAVVGVEQGATTAPATMSTLGTGLLKSHAQPGYIMTLAESKFLQSEAVLRGYLPGGDAVANTLFTSGISASMTLLGVTSANATTYLTASATSPRIGWQGALNDKIESIMTQKWIALNGINGLESWIEYTRTGYPNVPLSVAPTTPLYPTRPKRLMYPSSEYVANSGNVPVQAQADAFNSGPFWYVTI
jgi:hypothetical protein